MQKSVKIIEGLALHNEVYTSSSGINKVVEATLFDEPIYCMIHTKTGEYALMERSMDVLAMFTDTVENHGIAGLSNGRFRFRNYYFLSKLLYATYKKLDVDSIKTHRIKMKDTSLLKECRCHDLREQNLQDARDNYTVEIIPDEKGIPKHIRFSMREIYPLEIPAIQNYSSELYEMLNRFTGYWNTSNKRHYVSITRGCKMQIGRFVLIYKTHFEEYRGEDNPVEAFLADVPRLHEEYKNKNLDASHVNGQKWNNCDGNLMWMDSDVNKLMNDYITQFTGIYNASAIVTADGVILAVVTIGENAVCYFALETPERYANLQRLLMGKIPITSRLGSIYSVPSPKATHKRMTPEEKYVEETNEDISVYEELRDFIANEYATNPKKFRRLRTPYVITSTDGRITSDVLRDFAQVFLPFTAHLSGEVKHTIY